MVLEGWSSSNTFNVDDVGYANASDVGMNIGGKNDNAYDDSQNWSGLLSASGGSGFTNQGNGAFAGTDSNADLSNVTGASSGTNYTLLLLRLAQSVTPGSCTS